MKKVLTLILTLVMVFSLCACGGKEPEDSNATQQITEQETEQAESEQSIDESISEEVSQTEESSEPEEPEMLTAFDGKSPKIPSALFPDYLEVVELTTDNWKDYFEVVYDEEFQNYYLSCKAPLYDMTNLTFELKIVKEDSPLNDQTVDPKAGALVASYDNAEGLEYTIDDFECVATQGELIVGNIPEELWGTDGDTPVVYVGSNSGEQWMVIGRETSLGKFLD